MSGDSEAFNAFMRDLGLVMAADAQNRYREFGRGVLLVKFDQGHHKPGPFKTLYVPEAEAIEAGFSEEVIAAIRNYNPEREAILFADVPGREEIKLVVVAVEVKSGPAARPELN